jgi:hypothetical protein
VLNNKTKVFAMETFFFVDNRNISGVQMKIISLVLLIEVFGYFSVDKIMTSEWE